MALRDRGDFILGRAQLASLAKLAAVSDEALLQVKEHPREDPLRYGRCSVWITPLGKDSARVEKDGSISATEPAGL